jgi:hypothetical protein
LAHSPKMAVRIPYLGIVVTIHIHHGINKLSTQLMVVTDIDSVIVKAVSNVRNFMVMLKTMVMRSPLKVTMVMLKTMVMRSPLKVTMVRTPTMVVMHVDVHSGHKSMVVRAPLMLVTHMDMHCGRTPSMVVRTP